MKAAVKAILSFMLTSWTYSEIILVAPEVEPVTKKIVTVLTIPTHDKWAVYEDSEQQAKVTEELNGFFEKIGLTVESNESDDFDLERYLAMPDNIKTEIKQPFHVSIFENSNLNKRLYQRF